MNSVMSASRGLAGQGGVRYLAARWVIHAALVAEAAIHLGNGEGGDVVDLELVRTHDNLPLLLGSTLAGGLRDRLCDALLGDRNPETGAASERVITALLGGRRGDPDGSQSALIVRDAVGRAKLPAELRDGVRITPETGLAEDRAKWDYEVWPPGTRFDVRLHLLVSDDQPESGVDETELLAALVTALEGFGSGDIRVGARGLRGLGRCRLENIRAHRYALGRDASAWLAWLATGLVGRDEMPAEVPVAQTVEQAIEGACSRGRPPGQTEELRTVIKKFREHASQRSPRLVLVVPVRFHGGVLIRSPQGSPSGADVRHLRSGQVPILSGSSKGGALRQRARRIARAMRPDDAREWVVRLFGSEPPARSARRDGQSLSASRLIAEDDQLRGGHELQVTRIAIDRFTQGPMPGALLQEEPVYGATADLRFTLRLPPEDGALARAFCGFLLLLVKDVLLGDVPVGGTTGVGRGALRPAGPLRVTWGSWTEYEIDLWAPPHDFRQWADDAVRTFVEHALLIPREAGAGVRV